jgi:23S rRNA pseudouridine1911/1915/1917 synthase
VPDASSPAPLSILAEADDWLAVDKPAGLPSHARDPRELGTVAGLLLARHPELRSVGDPLAPGLVHRLDTGTSGVLLAARSARSWARFRDAFRAGRVRKQYLAIVDGCPAAGTVVDTPLAHDPRDRGRMVAATGTLRRWPARTHLLAVDALPDGRARVLVEIPTGVTHQIRVHLALLGTPVVGDVQYGAPAASDVAAGRHALHAARIDVPDCGVAVDAPLPPDLAAFLRG